MAASGVFLFHSCVHTHTRSLRDRDVDVPCASVGRGNFRGQCLERVASCRAQLRPAPTGSGSLTGASPGNCGEGLGGVRLCEWCVPVLSVYFRAGLLVTPCALEPTQHEFLLSSPAPKHPPALVVRPSSILLSLLSSSLTLAPSPLAPAAPPPHTHSTRAFIHAWAPCNQPSLDAS